MVPGTLHGDKGFTVGAVANGLGRISALAILVLCVTCPSAQATYPGGNGLISFTGPELSGAGPQTYVVKPDGRNAHAVTATMYLRGETRWSPDGRLLAIEGGNHYAGVMALRADSLEGEPVVWGDGVWFVGGGAWLGLPAWSGDGRRMVGLGWTETPYDPSGLYMASTISPADPRASGPPYLVQANWRGGTPVWSPDGSLLAFDGCGSDDGSMCGIWTMRPDQPDSARLVVRSDGTFPVHNPDWSPDSQRIAYEVGHTGGTGRGIHTVRRDGSDVRRISTGGYTPAYSPDGKQIVFSQQNGLYTMDVDGANHRRIFVGANLEPDWQRVDVPVDPDTDGDGVRDSVDRCPRVAGHPSNGGCPEVKSDSDSDGDGVLDSTDRCPATPGPAGNGGCPIPQVDTDGDGVPDSTDRCPATAGTRANDGCPEGRVDSDRDGIVDRADDCPAVSGDPRNGGCPIGQVDSDSDGVVDTSDGCPGIAGPPENRGCPPGHADHDRPVRPLALSVKVRQLPGRRLRVTGVLRRPSHLASSVCSGPVVVRLERSGRGFLTRRTSVRPDCSYSTTLSSNRMRRRPGRFSLVVRFLGNDRLTAYKTRPARVRVR